MFEVLITDLKDQFTIDKSIKLKLTDYDPVKYVYLVKITKDD